MRNTTVTVRGLIVSVALLVGSAATLSGCAAARTEVGTMSALCYTSIPVVRSALGKPAQLLPPTTTTSVGSEVSSPTSTTAPPRTRRGPDPVFVGVVNASQKQIDAFGKTHDYLRSQLDERNGGPIKNVCLVAFRGSFDPATMKYVTGPVPPVGQRIYAIGVVSQPHDKLLAVFIRSREPIRFTHDIVGGG